MARARKSGRRGPWGAVALKRPVADRSKLHDLEDKHDGIDRSRHLVRGGRFSGSYMMGTNGGSTYEKGLRPPPRKLPQAAVATATPAKHPPPLMGLQNGIGQGGLVPIDDTSQIPAKSVGLLKITPSQGPMRYGTAWLIGPNTLATAAHNLLSPDAGPTQSLEVGLAYDGNSAGGGWQTIVDNALPQAWLDHPSSDNPHDFAVLKIEDPSVGNALGWFGYADYADDKFGNMIINIYGYPINEPEHFHMYGAGGRIVNFDQGRLYYNCITSGGMSGAPVIALFGEQRIVVGIHVAGGSASNVATRVTDEVYGLFQKYQSWP